MSVKSNDKRRKTTDELCFNEDKKLTSSISFEAELKTDKKLISTSFCEIELNITRFLIKNETSAKRSFS